MTVRVRRLKPSTRLDLVKPSAGAFDRARRRAHVLAADGITESVRRIIDARP
jgi:hypothetical protein